MLNIKNIKNIKNFQIIKDLRLWNFSQKAVYFLKKDIPISFNRSLKKGTLVGVETNEPFGYYVTRLTQNQLKTLNNDLSAIVCDIVCHTSINANIEANAYIINDNIPIIINNKKTTWGYIKNLDHECYRIKSEIEEIMDNDELLDEDGDLKYDWHDFMSDKELARIDELEDKLIELGEVQRQVRDGLFEIVKDSNFIYLEIEPDC